jgi:hypothetical protein
MYFAVNGQLISKFNYRPVLRFPAPWFWNTVWINCQAVFFVMPIPSFSLVSLLYCTYPTVLYVLYRMYVGSLFASVKVTYEILDPRSSILKLRKRDGVHRFCQR